MAKINSEIGDSDQTVHVTGPSATGRTGPVIPDHEMVRCIGRGSYGEVWLARTAVDTWRAVKVVYRDRFTDVRPYEREFSGIQNYEPISRTHEGLVDVLQIGRNDSEGYFYYVMELADTRFRIDKMENGKREAAALHYEPKTLVSEIRARGRLQVQECVQLGMTLCLALGHLHRNRLIHRDVKPSNIIFVDGVPKLADIGLVAGLAQAHSFVGTEGFIPPEGPNSPQADLYALGKVLYEASMGKDRHDFPEPLTAGLESNSESAALMELNEVLLRACAPNRTERYQSAEQMNADLALLHSGESVHKKRLLERRLKLLTRAAIATTAMVILGAVPYYAAIHEARIARTALKEKMAQAQRADREAVRARAAEADAEAKLWKSYLNEAQARRLSGRVGRRFEALDALKSAAAIRPSIELRNEAITCFALPDLHLGKVWGQPTGAQILTFDEAYERYVLLHTNGLLSICRSVDDAEIFRIPGFEYPLPGYGPIAEFSQDGRFLAVASGERIRRLEIWDLTQAQRLERFDGRLARCFAFAPDSRRLAISFIEGDDKAHPIIFYDLIQRRIERQFDPGVLPYCLKFRPHGTQLAIASTWTNDVLLVSVPDGTMEEQLPHPHFVFRLDWSPEGTRLATACDDANVYLWNLSGELPHEQRRQMIPAHQRAANGVSFSADGAFLATAGEDGFVRFWNPRTLQRLLELQAWSLGGFSQRGYRLSLSRARSEHAIAELDPARECRTLGAGLLPSGASVHRCDISRDGKLLLTAHQDGLRMWNLDSGVIVGFEPETDTQWPLFEPSLERCITLSPLRGVKEWDVSRGPQDSWVTFAFRRLLAEPGPLELALSQDGSLAALTGQGGGIRVLSLGSGSDVSAWRVKALALRPAFGRDGKLAVSLVMADTLAAPPMPPVKVFDPLTKAQVIEFSHHMGGRLLFSPDGKWLMVGDNLEYCLRDTDQWKARYSIPTKRGMPGIMAFSPDSSMIAIVPDRDSIQLVESTSGAELAVLRAAESHEISSLQFTLDGSRLVVCYVAPKIDVWDLALLHRDLAAMNLDWQIKPSTSTR